jgi:DNA polymerase-3 subunit delta'
MSLYDRVYGQPLVVEQLQRAAAHPVHAYLFVGPPGTGKREAALAFAAHLLCPNGGDGTCRTCRQVLEGKHVDVVVVERAGPFITVDQAHEISRMAARTPSEGRRKVLILVDFHLAERAVPALLKTIEEPPLSAVFVVLADHVPPELVTIASRCIRIDFPPLSPDAIQAALVAEGIPADDATLAATNAGGRLDRARVLAVDPEVAARRAAWEAVPARLDGTGATVAVIVAELLELLQRASGGEERDRREQRRLRTDELRAGLATLAGGYRQRAVNAKSPRDVKAALDAAHAVNAAAEALIRNPNEALLLQALLLRL